jgi:hypothetical protein
MKKFWEWLIESSFNISISYDRVTAALKAVAEKHIDYILDRETEVQQFNPQIFNQQIKSTLRNYPLIKNLLNSLESKNFRYIWDQQTKLRKWIETRPRDEYKNLRDLLKKISTYTDYLIPNPSAKQDVENALNQSIEGTKINMEKIYHMIESAISRIQMWNNSTITIVAEAPQNEYGTILEPGDMAEISVNNASFILFLSPEGIEIDDVLDGGDEDFFSSAAMQSDYFNLINELKNPGSTSKGKTLTLYTARPVKDRNQYLSTNSLPSNIFLTNDYNHAAGLASDLGSNEIRDIWKVRIDSKYITQTLDGPVKYYQVTSNAPVVSMSLVSPGESRF